MNEIIISCECGGNVQLVDGAHWKLFVCKSCDAKFYI